MDINLKNKETIIKLFKELNHSDKDSLVEVLSHYLYKTSSVNISKPFSEYISARKFKENFLDHC